jgi:Dolichyl-phosphate-mannose-protein mannosyltransferase
MLAIFPLFLVLGLFLPGFFIAKYLRHALWWASAFVISLLILFHSIFWLGVFHVPIRLWTVLPILLAASGGAAWLQRRFAIGVETNPAPPWTTEDRILLLSSGMVGVVLLVHSAIAPLMGGDAPFRWDFLAQRLLALGNFDFYPPLTPADFRTYFFVDGIPPMVSFTYWWVYASAGRYLATPTCVFVAAQFVCTLGFTYGAAAAVFSRRAGVVALAMLAASPLYFRSVAMAQETGMTALAIAATIYFVVTARRPNDVPAMASAGLAAALCALSREYGWIAVIAGVIALLWRRQGLKQVFVFGAVATAAAAPWYARNWILTGNPFYSLRFGGFAVNPIHDRILHSYSASLGVQSWTSATWASVLFPLLFFATFQVLAGIPGGFTRFRRQGYLMVIALLLVAVWIQSIGYTSGGAEISTRVLTPALVLLSITGAGLLEPLTRRARWYTALGIAIIACQIWTAAQGAVYPKDLLALRPGQWLESAFPRIAAPAEFQIRDQLVRILPPGYRVLSDSAYLHAALVDAGIEVVPVWSPEVGFIFSSSPEESERQLRALRIGSVVVYPQTMNMGYLTSASPFYAALPERWRALAQVGDFLFVLVPKTP